MLLLHGNRNDSNSMDLHDITMNNSLIEMSTIPKYAFTLHHCNVYLTKKGVNQLSVIVSNIMETVTTLLTVTCIL